ncbi:MAG: Hsp70 family protein [Pseudonocardiales bacterium]|nr:Hsp70 family protein [Pseudonocardiales bacterium]
MSYWLGIDVGTTFTAAAICREEAGQRALPEVIPLGTRSTAVSSVVYLAPDGQVVVGEAAERRAVTHPERVVREFKRRIGDEVPMVIGGLPHSAPEIAAKVLRWVIDRVAQREGGSATGIVITHPASWGTYKIQTMAQALRAAGLPEITFCTEPEAAAASYALQERIEPGSTIAVYDLGGGTFDAAVVRKTDASTFSVLGHPQGLDHLGGADFDDAVVNHVLAAVPALAKLDPTDPTTLAATAALRRECTDAKEALSADTEVTIPVLAPGIQSQVRLVRAEFEDMIRPHVARTIEALHQALRSAELTAQDLDVVLLVGGSSRVPLVAQLVSAELGRPVAIDADPKAAIALGAALVALPTDTTAADLACDPPAQGDAVPAPPTVRTESQVPGFAQVEAPQRPSLTAIPLDVESAQLHWRRASSRRVKRVTLAGVLALITAAGVASVPFLTSHSGPIPQANAGTPAPSAPLAPRTSAADAASPTANAGSGRANNESSWREGSGGAVHTTPPAEPDKPASGAKPDPATVPPSAPAPPWVTSYTWTTSWSIPPSPRSTPPEPTTMTNPTPTPVQTTKASPPPTTTTAVPTTRATPVTTASPRHGSHT